MALPGSNEHWRVLVTGGAGFIGSRLVQRIERDWPNARVTVIDDFRSGDFRNLQGFRGDLLAEDIARLNLPGFFSARDFDAVFHLASITDTREQNQHKMCWDNIEGFRNLLQFLEPARVPVTYASSAATYGIDGKVNIESDPRKPANVYGFSKVQLENLAARYIDRAGNAGWMINAVRYFNVYGPHEQHKGPMASMIFQLFQQMMGGNRPRVFKNGEHKRDFVHVDDAVECTLRAMGAGKPGVFNTGSGQAASFNDVIAQLNKSLGTRLEPEYIENPYPFFQPFTQADLSRSREILGYSPKFSLADGVADYVKWLTT